MSGYVSRLIRTEDSLAALEEVLVKHHGDMSAACAAVGCSVASVVHWMEDDPASASRLRVAQQIGWTTLESAAYQRAVHGVEEAVYFKGEVCGYKTVYSDGLMSQMLKARVPAYRAEHEAGPKMIVNIMPRANDYEEWVGMRQHTLKLLASEVKEAPDYTEYEPVTESALRDVL